MPNNFTYLALGDSYTIGEAVPLLKSYPYQTIQSLRKKGLDFLAPEIIAKTGWTTDELLSAIDGYTFLNSYDFVSLLIGVNNQYRGRSAEEYEQEFTSLLLRAVQFGNKNPSRVFVLSIPDYSATPFAQKLNSEKIALEINRYNETNKKISEQFGVHYIDITPSTRQAANDPSRMAEDGLHPSEIEYARWSILLSDLIYRSLKK